MLEGVRACGKTRTALEAAGSSVLMDDPAARVLNDLAPGSSFSPERGPVLTLDDGTVTCGLRRLCP